MRTPPTGRQHTSTIKDIQLVQAKLQETVPFDLSSDGHKVVIH
jgi:hypothetical protein